MATITSIGTGSGIDLEGLVDQIIEAERAPTEQRLEFREISAEASISAYGSLKSALDSLKSTLSGISDTDDTAIRTAKSSDDEYVSISAENNALVGSHDIQVLNLASNHKLASDDFVGPAAVVGSGTLTIGLGNASFDVVIEEDVNDKLNEIRDAINEAAGDRNIRASLITVDDGLGEGGTVSKLVLTATEGGEANTISVDVVDDDGDNENDEGLSRFFFDPEAVGGTQMSEISEASDARITVDGFIASSKTNEFDGVLDGVSITANREPEDALNPESARISIQESTSALTANIDSFVNSYNELFITIGALTGFNASTEDAGLLTGDASVRQIETLMRRALFSQVGDESAPFRNLASIGVTTERDGTISLDSGKLAKAASGDVQGISDLLSGENGIMGNLESLVDSFLRSDGIIQTRTDGLDQQIRDVADQREDLQRRLDSVEARFRRQFAGLDTLIAQLQSTGSFLTAQLANVASITNNRN